MEIFLIFIFAGLLAGFLAGLLGIGGGFIVVPVLIFVLPGAGFSEAHLAHVAIGTSLLCICITSLASTRAHHLKKAVDWDLFKLIVPGLIIGALAGSAIAAWEPSASAIFAARSVSNRWSMKASFPNGCR